MPSSNIVIDLSHHNGQINMSAAANGGVHAVIHKATQGWKYFDPKYQANRNAAMSEGLLWGAYHFGAGADGVAQADFFLSRVQPDNATLLVLDFEANAADSSMDLIEAQAFVTHLHQVTGRWPGLYAGQYLKELLGLRPIQCSRIAGCGSHSMAPPPCFRPVGLPGLCGSTPMAPLVRSLMKFLVLDIATEICSMEPPQI